MEMDCIEIKNEEEQSEDMFVDQTSEDESEDARVYPRVGEEFQVAIPNLATEAERLQLRSDPIYQEPELSIPLVWSRSRKELNEPVQDHCGQVMEGNSSSLANGTYGEYTPVPYSPSASWSKVEAQSFLLGLYIFDKNLIQVQNFVDSKKMGDVLSYYYGAFYRSSEYQRWAECRKRKSRKCILGARIFTGPRQQELLSRMVSLVSQEVHSNLVEVFKSFNEGKFAFEEFIFTMKSKVDMQVLIDVVGIGTGKSDLTGMVDTGKPNQSSARAEIPMGKACSSLSSADIVNILTGDYRISKAKSNDLFWEAVWPRLLARGWHSEQPRDLVQSGAKNTLVFLLPGVKKFSRKKLTKGDHYFDSVSDVLSKVASDPRLLKLDSDEAGDPTGRENDVEMFPDKKKKSNYLRTRLPECSPNLMKFTVVDTSLVYVEEPFKVRSLRSLPAGIAIGIPESSEKSGDRGDDSSEEKSEPEKGPSRKRNEVQECKENDQKRRRSRPAKKKQEQQESVESAAVPSVGVPANGHLPAAAEQGFGTSGRMISFTTTAYHSEEPENLGQQLFGPSVSKRRRVAPCSSNTEKRRQKLAVYRSPNCKADAAAAAAESPRLSTPFVSSSASNGPDTSFPEVTHVESFMSSGPFEYSNYGSSFEYGGYPHGHTKQSSQVVQEMCSVSTETAISLENLPDAHYSARQAPAANVDVSYFQTSENASMISFEKPAAAPPDAPEPSSKLAEEPPNGRRQSVRNRPPTTRALEAVAYGFLDTKKSRSSSYLPSRKPSRRHRPPSRLADSLPPPSPPLPSPPPPPAAATDEAGFVAVSSGQQYQHSFFHPAQ